MYPAKYAAHLYMYSLPVTDSRYICSIEGTSAYRQTCSVALGGINPWAEVSSPVEYRKMARTILSDNSIICCIISNWYAFNNFKLTGCSLQLQSIMVVSYIKLVCNNFKWIGYSTIYLCNSKVMVDRLEVIRHNFGMPHWITAVLVHVRVK